MFKSKKSKINPQDLENFIRKQRVRREARMNKIRAEIAIGLISFQ